MKSLKRNERIKELKKELIILEIEEDIELGLIDNYPSDTIKDIEIIAFILDGESEYPISDAVEIIKKERTLTDSGLEEYNKMKRSW